MGHENNVGGVGGGWGGAGLFCVAVVVGLCGYRQGNEEEED